jgi:urea transporter
MKNIMLDLNVLRFVMECWFSLKASYSFDLYNISWSNPVLMFPASS